MRRTLFGGLVIATLALPAAAFAAQNRQLPNTPPSQTFRSTMRQFPQNGPAESGTATQTPNAHGTIGAGQMGHDVPAHNDSPGATKIDNDTRAPVNDIQVGQGTTDVPQSKNPPPAR